MKPWHLLKFEQKILNFYIPSFLYKEFIQMKDKDN